MSTENVNEDEKQKLLTEYRTLRTTAREQEDKIFELVAVHAKHVEKMNSVQFKYTRLLNQGESKYNFSIALTVEHSS